MNTTVKLSLSSKDKLERLQAKLRLDADLKFDQFRLLGSLIEYCENDINRFISFIKGISLSDEEIKQIHKDVVLEGAYFSPENSDDELIYGD